VPIKSIEIICIPCNKCERLKTDIAEIIKTIELQNKIKIYYEFKHIPPLAGYRHLQPESLADPCPYYQRQCGNGGQN
jgi:hypothetical protein